MASISGIANAAILFILNATTMDPSRGDLKFKYLMLFVTAFLIFFMGKDYCLKHTAIIIEKILSRVRLRVLDKIRKAPLKQIEDMGSAEIHTKLTHNVNTISESALAAITACQSVVMLVICSIYIAWLSLPVFLGSAGLITLSVFYFNIKSNEAQTFLQKATAVQGHFFQIINGMLLGFKELKLSRKKNEAYFHDIKAISEKSEDLLIQTQLKFIPGMILAELTFYFLLAGVVFLMPRFGSNYSEMVPKLTTSILFIMGPIITIVSAMPMITRSNVAIAEIWGLEKQLDAASEPAGGDSPAKSYFQELCLEDIVFSYRDQYNNTLFTIDNINLTIKKGELLFIVGGNGSGKSTILKLLTGLYYPEAGTMRLNGKPVTRSDYPAFRELFSIIFTDFHLFEKLYGLDFIDREKLDYYMKKMELDTKTAYQENGFTTIKLSTGQKKRLAMIMALMEESDIYVFDELAADQAPAFRRYFYEILLKELQKQGKTIIVVSHDDRYFNVADRIIEMDYGRLTREAQKNG